MPELKIFSGRAHQTLTDEICEQLGVGHGSVTLYSFSDGETYVQIDENVRGADVFVIQPTCPPAVNDNLMELLIMLDALKRSSARRITAVIPYYGYARQDRKDKPRVPITAKLVADLISAAGADRVLTLDLHAAQIQGFFNIPVDHLFAAPVIVDHLKSLDLEDLTIVSPDAGGVERARAYAKRLGASLAIIDKRRFATNQTEVMNIIGDVEGRNVVIVDDIIDTAGTLIHSVQALLRKRRPLHLRRLHARGALGAGSATHQHLAARHGHRHEQHPDGREGSGLSQAQDRSRSPASWPRRSREFTARTRSRRCSRCRSRIADRGS